MHVLITDGRAIIQDVRPILDLVGHSTSQLSILILCSVIRAVGNVIAIFEFGRTLTHLLQIYRGVRKTAMIIMRTTYIHWTYRYIQLQTCGTSMYLNLCITHIAARSLALVSKIRIRSARKLCIFEARKALNCTARMASFAHPE